MPDLIGERRLRMLTYASYNADVCCRMRLQVLRMLDLIGDLRLRVRVPNLLALYQVNPSFTCFSSTKVKSTNSDANAPARQQTLPCSYGCCSAPRSSLARTESGC